MEALKGTYLDAASHMKITYTMTFERTLTNRLDFIFFLKMYVRC